MPILNLLLLSLCLLGSAPAFAGPVRVERDGRRWRVTNVAGAPMAALRVGARTIERLEAGEQVLVAADDEDPPMVIGCFALDGWEGALEHLDAAWAPFHLRTAGYFLDAVRPGTAGDPKTAANLERLARFSPERAAAWARPPAIRLALAARAARHGAPGGLLARLLSEIAPAGAPAPLPSPYADLGRPPDEVRAALEWHAAAATPILAGAPAWRADRGFATPALLLAFPSSRSAVLDRLEREDSDGARRALRAWGAATPPLPTRPLLEMVSEGLRAGDFRAAARAAALVAGALGARGAGANDDECREVQYALDVAAQRALAFAQPTAAEANLVLALGAGPPSRSLALRIAEVWRFRGDAAFRGADLARATGHYRAAWLVAGQEIDRARLADTLAELARLQFAGEDLTTGDRFLERAKALAPLRDKVRAAEQARPRTDSRARVGLVLIIIFLGLFAVRRFRGIFRRRRR